MWYFGEYFPKKPGHLLWNWSFVLQLTKSWKSPLSRLGYRVRLDWFFLIIFLWKIVFYVGAQEEIGVTLTPPTGRQRAEEWPGLRTVRHLNIKFEHTKRYLKAVSCLYIADEFKRHLPFTTYEYYLEWTISHLLFCFFP